MAALRPVLGGRRRAVRGRLLLGGGGRGGVRVRGRVVLAEGEAEYEGGSDDHAVFPIPRPRACT